MDRVYLALGDSMSIDDYTGVEGGGAVRQLHRALPGRWTLRDRTRDGCRIPGVPRDERGDLITLTIGGNDLLGELPHILANPADGPRTINRFAEEHLSLLRAIRAANPRAIFVVGDVYAPQSALPPEVERLLDQANARIAANTAEVGARLAGIRAAFRGKEATLLRLDIEPNLEGAAAIARLFREAAAIS